MAFQIELKKKQRKTFSHVWQYYIFQSVKLQCSLSFEPGTDRNEKGIFLSQFQLIVHFLNQRRNATFCCCCCKNSTNYQVTDMYLQWNIFLITENEEQNLKHYILRIFMHIYRVYIYEIIR